MSRMDDAYSRFDYGRVIAWPPRIEREWPFLRRFLEAGPSPRLLDLGCGTGEHARFLAAHDFDVVGLDSSAAMISQADDKPSPENLQFLEGSLQELDRVTSGRFGGAVCLGNTLPHLKKDDDLATFLAALRQRLVPSAPVIVQLLNYHRLVAADERALPVNLRADEDGEIVFLRLMTHHPDGMVSFFPSTLRLRPDSDPPLQVEASKRVDLRGWKVDELEAAFFEAGFPNIETFGAFDGSSFLAEKSKDLILVAQ